MCKYCNVDNYSGELIPFVKMVDGTRQHYEISLIEDLRNEGIYLQFLGTLSDIRVMIKYCPMCGCELNY